MYANAITWTASWTDTQIKQSLTSCLPLSPDATCVPIAKAAHNVSFGALETCDCVSHVPMILLLVMEPTGAVRLQWRLLSEQEQIHNTCFGRMEPSEQLAAVEKAAADLVNMQFTASGGIIMPLSMMKSTGKCLDRWLSRGLQQWVPKGDKGDVGLLYNARCVARHAVKLGSAAEAEDALSDALNLWAHKKLCTAATTTICDALFTAFTNPSYNLCRIRLSKEFACAGPITTE